MDNAKEQHKKRRKLPFKPEVYIFYISLFVGGIILMWIKGERNVYVTKEMEVPPTLVEFIDRGVIYLNDTLCLRTGGKLIDGPKDWYNGWTRPVNHSEVKKRPYNYVLYNLNTPFKVSKLANSDVIMVEKDGYTFRFRLEEKGSESEEEEL